MPHHDRRKAAPLAAALLAAALVTPGGAAAAAPAADPPAPAPGSSTDPGTYTNPVTEGVVDTFPDPTMVRGKDGAWYAYGTTNPVFNSRGERGERLLPVLRSEDMVDWEYAGEVFTRADQPGWWPSGARAWAPDIRYVDGRYLLTYGLNVGGVGLASSPTPTGPWTDEGVLVPRTGAGCATFDIDQAMFTDSGGDHYLVWGSYDRICVSALDETATELVGPVTTVAQGRRMEGGYLVQHDGAYYLFYSDGGCCDGAFSGYTVKVGRGDSPTGPFYDDRGVDLMAQGNNAGFVLSANGNAWVGPGHNALQTDLSGQDWIAYHAISKTDPEFGDVEGAPSNLSVRPMLLDRLDWVDGWPVVNGGAGPSEEPQESPVTSAAAGSDFEGGSLDGWRAAGDDAAAWDVAQVADAGGVLDQPVATSAVSRLATRGGLRGDVRLEGDVRLGEGDGGRAGVGLTAGAGAGVTAWVDRDAGRLELRGTGRGDDAVATAPLPDGFGYEDWHVLALEVRGGTATLEVSADRLLDPVATVELDLPARAQVGRSVTALSSGTAAQWNNLGAARLHEPSTQVVPDPRPGELLAAFSDDFDGSGRPEQADPAWSWVRGERADARLADGDLVWPTQDGDLNGGSNSASVLLRDAPEGDFVVETRLDFAPTVGNQQAGLVLYGDDDRYLKLSHTKLGLSRVPGTFLDVTEFLKEGARPTTTPPRAIADGPSFGALPADRTWLRLEHRWDAEAGEHDVRMASSTDGETWSWGSTWSLPGEDGDLRIGLVSMNRSGATAVFDYVRTYEAG